MYDPSELDDDNDNDDETTTPTMTNVCDPFLTLFQRHLHMLESLPPQLP